MTGKLYVQYLRSTQAGKEEGKEKEERVPFLDNWKASALELVFSSFS